MLRTYDGKGIQYDRSGNPVSYDGKTFSWNGKQLIKVTAADGSYTEFSYDANGIRTQKRQFASDGTLAYEVDYVWQDGLLTHQSMTYYFHMTLNGTEKVVELPFTAKFVYDESNTPVGCLVNDEMALAFVRNLQGDIIAVVNQEGTALLEYSYDPWGKVTITQNGENLTEQEAAIIAVLCPFAYRGYNYDFTTGLYYLQSRYYNPEWGRFLNVDDTNILLATQGENLGANLFAYCENNPVNNVDYSGTESVPLKILCVTAFTAFCGVLRSPMSFEIMTMENFTVNYSYVEKYNIAITHVTAYTHKWYYYTYYDICTLGGEVQGWINLINDIEYYLSIYDQAGNVKDAFSDVFSLMWKVGLGKAVTKTMSAELLVIISEVMPLITAVATAVGVSTFIVIAMLTIAKNQMKPILNSLPSNAWYLINWRVDVRRWTITGYTENMTLHLYTPLASIVTF